MVINAGTHDKDVAWLQKHASKFEVEIIERLNCYDCYSRSERCCQNPTSFDEAKQAATKDLTMFEGVAVGEWWIARTGYTGEDGYEIILPAGEVERFWQELLKVGVAPCGFSGS